MATVTEIEVRPSLGAWGRATRCPAFWTHVWLERLVGSTGRERPADGVAIIIRAPREVSNPSRMRVVGFLLNQP
jgi:hypothetical protein